MLSYLADENFNLNLVAGLVRRKPELDILLVQETPIAKGQDPAVLAHAAREGRILLTHDQKTLPGHAYQRVVAELPMPGVFVVGGSMTVAQAIEDLLLLAECSAEGEWEGLVRYLPL